MNPIDAELEPVGKGLSVLNPSGFKVVDEYASDWVMPNTAKILFLVLVFMAKLKKIPVKPELGLNRPIPLIRKSFSANESVIPEN